MNIEMRMIDAPWSKKNRLPAHDTENQIQSRDIIVIAVTEFRHNAVFAEQCHHLVESD
jgi:hypothetical protein